MTLSDAIREVLAALDAGTPVPASARKALRKQVKGTHELWYVPTVNEPGLTEAEHLVFGTAAQETAWLEGFDAAEGWDEPMYFDSEEDALEHIREA